MRTEQPCEEEQLAERYPGNLMPTMRHPKLMRGEPKTTQPKSHLLLS